MPDPAEPAEAAEVFDDAALDDEQRARRRPIRCCAGWPRPGARVRREADSTRQAADTLSDPAAGSPQTGGHAPWSSPAPTRDCCGRCSSRGARSRSSPGRVRGCPAGPAPSTSSSCWRRPAGTRRRPRPCSRRSAGLHAAARLPAALSLAEIAASRSTTLLPTVSADTLAVAVVVLRRPAPGRARPRGGRRGGGRRRWTRSRCPARPSADLAGNPAKELAIVLAEATPLVWGGSVLAARAARRIAEALRRASGRAALAADADHLLPVLAAAATAPTRSPTRSPTGRPRTARPALVLLDDASRREGRPGAARPPG